MLALRISTTPLWGLSPTCRDAARSIRQHTLTRWFSDALLSFSDAAQRPYHASALAVFRFHLSVFRFSQNLPFMSTRSRRSASMWGRYSLLYEAVMPPVSSLTTIARASVSLLIPLAARCLRPNSLGISRS